MRNITIGVLVILGFLFISCRDDSTAPVTGNLLLSVEYVGVTEASLHVRILQHLYHAKNTLAIQSSNSPLLRIVNSPPDTTLLISSLSPNSSYLFRALYQDISNRSDTLEALRVTTLDTSSHDFFWEWDTLGDDSPSRMFDVTLVGDSLAYAAGEFYLRDSLGNSDPIDYNFAKFNGKKWDIMRIQFYAICGQNTRTPFSTSSVFAFDSQNIWLAGGGTQIVHWDGNAQSSPVCVPISFAIEKIWGYQGNKLYAVGYQGSIVQFDGTYWHELQSGTTADINDVFGDSISSSGEMQVLAGATNIYSSGERTILKIDPSRNVSPLEWSPQQRVKTVWFSGRSQIFVGGGGLLVGRPGSWKSVTDLPPYFTEDIRGTSINNVFAVGDFGLVGHFNGQTWRYYPGLSMQGIFYAVAAYKNRVIIVGQLGNHAIVVRGTRRL